MIKSFGPVIKKGAEILVLGTMPGQASLAAAQYYAHRQNRFWAIAAAVFAGGDIPPSYEEKLKLLTANKTALWDTLESCRRIGSMDSAIKREKPNNIPALLKEYPTLKKIIFNGQASFKYFVKHFGPPQIDYLIMPSTSPANARVSFGQKLTLWRAALKP